MGDLVLICKETPGLGLVTQILSPRRVMVRHKHRGSNVEDEYHAKVLALIFRPQTPTYFLSISNQPMPHLLENFWAKLKQKLTWLMHSLPASTIFKAFILLREVWIWSETHYDYYHFWDTTLDQFLQFGAPWLLSTVELLAPRNRIFKFLDR